METTSIDLLSEEVILEQAGSGQRFLNYLIDAASFYFVAIGVGIFIGIFFPSTLSYIDEESVRFSIIDRIISLILYGLYMSIIEALFKGRSLGKLITGTKAVNEDGTTINTSTAFIRGFSRAVPFNVFSALGSPPYPWHDKWSKTYVVSIKNSILPS